MQSRLAFRFPLTFFENFGKKVVENPVRGNTIILNSVLFLTLVLGKGAERLVCRDGGDFKRRVKRGFVPYFIADYRFQKTCELLQKKQKNQSF